MKANIVIIENNIIATNTIRKKLTATLVQQGYKVTVLTSGTAEGLMQATQNHFNIIEINASNQNPIGVINYMRHLKKELKKINPDICLTFTIRPAIWGNIVTRQLHIPTVTNITGIGPLFEQNNLAYRAARILYKYVLKKQQKFFSKIMMIWIFF